MCCKSTGPGMSLMRVDNWTGSYQVVVSSGSNVSISLSCGSTIQKCRVILVLLNTGIKSNALVLGLHV